MLPGSGTAWGAGLVRVMRPNAKSVSNVMSRAMTKISFQVLLSHFRSSRRVIKYRVRKLPKNYENWMQYRDFLLNTYPDESKKWIFEKRFTKHLNNNYVARQQCRQLVLNDYENNLPVDNKPDPRDERIRKWRELL